MSAEVVQLTYIDYLEASYINSNLANLNSSLLISFKAQQI